jgi:hypothetical protein
MNTLRVVERNGDHVRYVIEDERGNDVGQGDGDFPEEIAEAASRHVSLAKVLAERLEQVQPVEASESPVAVKPAPSRYTEVYPDVPEHGADHAKDYVSKPELAQSLEPFRRADDEYQRRHSVTDGRLSQIDNWVEGIKAKLEGLPGVEYLRSLFAPLHHDHQDIDESVLGVQNLQSRHTLQLSKIERRLEMAITRQEVDQIVANISELLTMAPTMNQRLEVMEAAYKALHERVDGPVKGHHHKIGSHDHTMSDIKDLPQSEDARERAESMHTHRYTKHTAEGMRCAICDALQGPASTSGVTEGGDLG